MDDVKKTPYAEWLEGFIGEVLTHRPEKIGVCCMMEDGTRLTGYYGECSPEDKALLGMHLHADAMLDIVLANADRIVAAAEKMEDDRREE